jgi:DHA1 family tetracycline resistance protein-like MFS transporter
MEARQAAQGTRRRRAAAAFIYITVLLDILALGIVAPVWPELIRGFEHGDTRLAAVWFGVFSTAFALMQFICSPMLGSLSDRFGRRPVILLSVFGLAVDYAVMALAPSIGWLFLGRIVCGMTSAGYATAYAYLADVTPPAKRAGVFALVGAMAGLGFVAGPLLGGLLGQVGPRAPFWAAGALALLNGLYGLFVLPESLPRESRAPFSLKRANPVGAMGLLRSRPQLIGLAGVNFLLQLTQCIFTSIWVLYVAYRYDWSPPMVGLSLAAVGACTVIVSALLVRPAVAVLGERRCMALGLVCGAAAFAVFGLAGRGWIFFLGLPLMTLWNLTAPSVQGLMSRRVGADEQGRLQGANASLVSIASLFGPGLFSGVFALALSHPAWNLPGAPFFLAGGLLLAAAALGWAATAGGGSRSPSPRSGGGVARAPAP